MQHAYEQHSSAKKEGDIDLSREDFERIPEYLDSFTEVVYAITYSSGKTSVCVSKELPNGRMLLIEVVSKSRGALQFKNAIGVSEEKYQTDYLDVYKKRAESNTRGSKRSNNSLRDDVSSNNSIFSPDENVKQKSSLRDQNESFHGSGAVKNTTREGGVKHSIRETTDGRYVAVVDNDILSGINTSHWDNKTKNAAKKAAADALKKFHGGFTINGIEYVDSKRSRDEYTRSNYTEALANKNRNAYLDKMRAASVLDDVIRVSTDWTKDGTLKYNRSDFVDFVRGKTLIQSGDNTYSAVVLAGINKEGSAVFYDVVGINPDKFSIKESEFPTADSTNKSPTAILGNSDMKKIPQNGEHVNQKSSLRDQDVQKMNA